MLRSRLRQLRGEQTEGGFSLVELIVTVAIVGIIVSGLTGVVISYLKTTVDTQSRLTESLELQFVTAYWQRDVSSIGVRDTNYDDAEDVHAFPLQQSVNLSPCAGAASLNHVVTLAWSEYVDPGLESDDPAGMVKVKVTYGTRGASGNLELVRVRCGSADKETPVANHLTSVPTVTCTGGGVSGCDDSTGRVPTRISMELSVRDPEGRGNTDIIKQVLQGERRQS